MKIWFLLALPLLVGCLTSSKSAPKLSFAQVYTEPQQYRDKLVKVCGFATNTFENVQVSETSKRDWRNKASGLGVDWLDKAEEIKTPKRRCVTGYIEPTCGWGNADSNSPDFQAPICIGTSTVFQWSIRQTELARN